MLVNLDVLTGLYLGLCLARLAGTTWSAGHINDKRYLNTTALNNVSISSTQHFLASSSITNIPFDKFQSPQTEVSSTTKVEVDFSDQIHLTEGTDRPPGVGSTALHSTESETLQSLSSFPAQPIDNAPAPDIAFLGAQDVRTLEMAPAISSTPRNRIDETLELETHQTSFATYFTQPLKPVQAKQSVPGTSGYTSAAASSKPYAPAAPKNTVMPPTSTVKPNIQSESLEATAHISIKTDSTISSPTSGLLFEKSVTEKSARHPFTRPSQTPSADPYHQSNSGSQEKPNPATSAGIAIGTISLAAFAGLAGFWIFFRYKRYGKSCKNTRNGTWTGNLIASFKGVFRQKEMPFKRNRGINEAKISAPFAQTNSLNWS